jgi:hypothetical protein
LPLPKPPEGVAPGLKEGMSVGRAPPLGRALAFGVGTSIPAALRHSCIFWNCALSRMPPPPPLPG